MKTFKIFSIIAIVFLVSLCFSQAQVPTKSDDLSTVQKNFMNYVIYAGELEKQNASAMQWINSIAEELGKAKTFNEAQLDTLRAKYRIPKAEGKINDKQGNKTSGK